MDNFPYLGVDHIKDFVISNQKEFSKYVNHCSSGLIYTDCISVLRSTWPVDDDLRVHYYMGHSCHGFATHDIAA